MTTTEAEAMSAPLSAVDSMLAALRQVQEAEEPLSGFEAGEILVAAGWACFPVPAGRKFDQGYSYVDATTSPAEWRELVTRLQARNRYITDVNVAVCPFKCAVPMTVVDHDSAVGLFDFTNEWHDKTGGAPDTLRIASPSGNEHYWFENEEPLANGYHPWGGETRSANGHVLLPPSWADEGSYQAINFNRPVRIDDVPWVLRGGRRRADDRERSRLTHSDVDIEIAKLSVREWAPGGHDMLDAIISKMTSVGHPGRNPAMAAAVNDMLDASLTGLIPAREGLALLGAAYAKHVSDTRDEEQALGEVARMSKVWVERHPHLDDEIGAVAWAQKEGQNLGSAAAASTLSSAEMMAAAASVTSTPPRSESAASEARLVETPAEGKREVPAAAEAAEEPAEEPAGSGLPPEAEKMIAAETLRLAARREAERRLRVIEDAGSWTMPDSRHTLREELELEDPPIQWEIDQLHEVGTNVLLTAAFKTGKTTLALNLMKARMDGSLFLGVFPVAPRNGRVAWWNFELTETQARRWLRDMGVKKPENGSVLHFRGHKLPIHSDYVRDQLVSWLKEREVRYLIVDPYGSAFGGKENDNDDVREWTRRLDEIKMLAGVESVVLVTHTGRGGQDAGFEHARGAAKLDDWADIRWVYTRDKEDSENNNRYFYAHGRDVDFEETGVKYDEATRGLLLDKAAPPKGSRDATPKDMDTIMKIVFAEPGLNRTEIVSRVGGNKQRVGKAFAKLVDDGFIIVEKGTKPNEKLHKASATFEWAQLNGAPESE